MRKPRYRIEFIPFTEYVERLNNSPLFSKDFDKKHFIKSIYDNPIKFITKL